MEVKNVKDLMKAYSDVYAQSEETLDENVQDAVKGALDAGAKFMKTNPVGKAVGAVIAPVGKGTGTVTASQQKQKISQNQNEEFDQVDEGRNTSLQALSRESERRKADKKRGRPETESETHSRLMMGKFRPGASKEERAEGGRQVLRDRGKVPKKGGKDMFEHILEHLVAEGYADTNESAIAIMANMSEEWRESIVDEVISEGEKPFPHEKVKAKQVALRDKGSAGLDRRMKMGMAVRRAKEADKKGGSQQDAGKDWYHGK
jgi:hypothetical protein